MAPYGKARNRSGTGRDKDVFRVFLTDPSGITVPLVSFYNVDSYYKAIKHGEQERVCAIGIEKRYS